LLVVAVCLGLYVKHRITVFVRDYTETKSKPIPVLTNAEPIQARVLSDLKQFKSNLDNMQTSEPLTLTSEDLNALVAMNPKLRERMCFKIENQGLAVQFTLDMRELSNGKVQDRFLNGTAHLQFQLAESMLQAHVVAVEANGKPFPKFLMSLIRRKNLAADANLNSDVAQILTQIEQITFAPDRVTITPVPPITRR
jgi:hypothetical protein